MKKLIILAIGFLSMSNIMAQDISDALRYSQDEIQGSARFRALSGAFGALGGDMSAVSINQMNLLLGKNSLSVLPMIRLLIMTTNGRYLDVIQILLISIF